MRKQDHRQPKAKTSARTNRRILTARPLPGQKRSGVVAKIPSLNTQHLFVSSNGGGKVNVQGKPVIDVVYASSPHALSIAMPNPWLSFLSCANSNATLEKKVAKPAWITTILAKVQIEIPAAPVFVVSSKSAKKSSKVWSRKLGDSKRRIAGRLSSSIIARKLLQVWNRT